MVLEIVTTDNNVKSRSSLLPRTKTIAMRPLESGVNKPRSVEVIGASRQASPKIIVIPGHVLVKARGKVNDIMAKKKTEVNVVTINNGVTPMTTIARVKRSAETSSSPMRQPVTQTTTPRKRSNLNHMSADEKLMRRKMKNRVAAQTARDKKRLRMDEMENRIKLLEEKNAQLEHNNHNLMELNKRLLEENQALNAAATSVSVVTPYYPLSPSPSGCSDAPSVSSVDVEVSSLVESRPFEPAEPISVLPLKEQGRYWAGEMRGLSKTTVCMVLRLLCLAFLLSNHPILTPRSLPSIQAPSHRHRFLRALIILKTIIRLWKDVKT